MEELTYIYFCRWFAKRFLHPDIVAEYDYIFLFDEDLGVENFHPLRYNNVLHTFTGASKNLNVDPINYFLQRNYMS